MKIEYAPKAGKQFSSLDKPIQNRIKRYMSEIAALGNPRSRGKALSSKTLLVYGATAWAITAFCAVSMMINWLSPSSKSITGQQCIDDRSQ